MDVKKGLQFLEFIDKWVVGNVHITDQYGAAATWINRWSPQGAKKEIGIRPDYDWKEIGRIMVKHNVGSVDSLKRFLESLYPNCFNHGPLDCCIARCSKPKPNEWQLACDDHTCHVCKDLCSEPDWFKEYWIRKKTGSVHIWTRNVKTQEMIEVQERRFPFGSCPGVLRQCQAEAKGYQKSPYCRGRVLPTIVDSHIPDLDLCDRCCESNQCTHSQGRLSKHIFDAHDPERRFARVCSQSTCTRRSVCLKCSASWFEYFGEKESLFCKDCTNTYLWCQKCHRFSLKAKPDIFFATKWVFSIGYYEYEKKPTKEKKQPNSAHLYCIQCLPTITHPNLTKNAFKVEKVRAATLEWRMCWKREHAWLKEQWKTRPLEWAKEHFLTLMGDRERWLMDHIPGAWEFFVDNEEAWNGTYFLMYRVAGLPKDLFIKIFLLL